MAPLITAIVRALRETFSRPTSWIVAAVVAGGMIAVTIGLMNYSLLKFISTSGFFSPAAKFKIIVATLGSFRTALSLAEQIVTIINALLAGVNVSVLVYYLKKRAALRKAMGTSVFGILASFLGIGCASCGSVILVSLFGLTAAGNLIRLLPLQGMEFGLISIVILVSVLGLVAAKLKSPLLCKK